MFVLSINKKKLLMIGACVVAAALVCFIAIALFNNAQVPDKSSCESIGEFSLDAKNLSQQKSFLQQFGYNIVGDAIKTSEVTIPEEFNDTYKKYNDLQICQGLDLSKFNGRQVLQIVYMVEPVTSASEKFATDDSEQTDLYAVLLIYKDKVIGGHIETGLQNQVLKSFCE